MILSKRKIVGQCLEYTTQPITQRITQQCIEEARVCPDRGTLGLVYPKKAARCSTVASIAKASARHLAIHCVCNLRSWAFR